MTRGNFVLITNTANWMSIQFNGDMYPSCNGKFVYHMLESVETYDDLAAAILKFDGECFGYADMRFGCANMHNIDMAPKSISDNIDFSKDYFAIYNSDYLYIKNASDEECTIIAKNEMEQTIKPGEIQVWKFGCLVQPDAKDLELNDDEKKIVYGEHPTEPSSRAESSENNIVYNDQQADASFNDRLQTIFEECDSFLENLPKGLTDDEKRILPPVVMLWSALKKNSEK